MSIATNAASNNVLPDSGAWWIVALQLPGEHVVEVVQH